MWHQRCKGITLLHSHGIGPWRNPKCLSHSGALSKLDWLTYLWNGCIPPSICKYSRTGTKAIQPPTSSSRAWNWVIHTCLQGLCSHPHLHTSIGGWWFRLLELFQEQLNKQIHWAQSIVGRTVSIWNRLDIRDNLECSYSTSSDSDVFPISILCKLLPNTQCSSTGICIGSGIGQPPWWRATTFLNAYFVIINNNGQTETPFNLIELIGRIWNAYSPLFSWIFSFWSTIKDWNYTGKILTISLINWIQ